MAAILAQLRGPVAIQAKAEDSKLPISLVPPQGDYKKEQEAQPAPTLSTLQTRLPVKLITPSQGKRVTKSGRYNLYAELFDVFGDEVAVSGNAGKYLIQLGAAPNRTWTSLIGNCLEINTYNTLFQEFFVRSIEVCFQPNNLSSSNSSASGNAAGSPGDLNTTGAVFTFLPDNVPTLSDLPTAYQKAQLQKQFVVFNLAGPFRKVFHNPTKFSWDGPLADQASGNTDMGWMSFSQGITNTKLGGIFQIAGPYPSGAAVGIGDLLELGKFGFVFYRAKLGLRGRI